MKFSSFVFLGLILAVGVNAQRGARPKNAKGYDIYRCSNPQNAEGEYQPICALSKVILSEYTTHMQIESSNVAVEKIEQVNLNRGWGARTSLIHTLSNDVCTTFPHLKVIDGVNMDLHKIDVGAFDECKELERLNLFNNRLKNLDANIFQHNTKLKYVNLGENELEEKDMAAIFNKLPGVIEILLVANQIKKFPIEEINKMDHLELLDLAYNEKYDELNIDEMLIKFPNLKKLGLCKVDVESSNFEEIQQKLASKNVEIFCK